MSRLLIFLGMAFFIQFYSSCKHRDTSSTAMSTGGNQIKAANQDEIRKQIYLLGLPITAEKCNKLSSEGKWVCDCWNYNNFTGDSNHENECFDWCIKAGQCKPIGTIDGSANVTTAKTVLAPSTKEPVKPVQAPTPKPVVAPKVETPRQEPVSTTNEKLPILTKGTLKTQLEPDLRQYGIAKRQTPWWTRAVGTIVAFT